MEPEFRPTPESIAQKVFGTAVDVVVEAAEAVADSALDAATSAINAVAKSTESPEIYAGRQAYEAHKGATVNLMAAGNLSFSRGHSPTMGIPQPSPHFGLAATYSSSSGGASSSERIATDGPNLLAQSAEAFATGVRERMKERLRRAGVTITRG